MKEVCLREKSLSRNRMMVKMESLMTVRIRIVAVAAIALVLTSCATTGFLHGGVLDSFLGIAAPIVAEKLLKTPPPITTSFSDATTEIAFLDGFNPTASEFTSMEMMSREGLSGYRLGYGLYSLEAQSYCLQAGTYGAGKGEGYLYAPLAGPRASIVQNLLRRSLDSEVPQQDVQVLLWAITSRTKLSDMSPQNQQTAAVLLSKDDLFELNGGALGLIPEDLLRTVVAHLPHQVQQIYYAEQRIRQIMTSQTGFAYGDLERLAVLTGLAPAEHKIRDVPRGRWSYYRGGYFVRYVPYGYQQTRFEVFRPRPFKVERDEWGRIIALDDGEMIRIETSYREKADRVVLLKDGFGAHQFNDIRIVMRAARAGKKNSVLRKKIRTRVSTLVESGAAREERRAVGSGFSRQVEKLKKQREQLSEILDVSGRPLDAAARKEVLDVVAYVDAIKLALKLLGEKKMESWMRIPLFMISQLPYARLAVLLSAGDVVGLDVIGNWVFDPTEHVIVPANTHGQRLISAGRPARDEERFSHQVEENGGRCPESVRQRYGNKNSHRYRSSTGRDGHWYLTINSLGKSKASPSQVMNLFKRRFTVVFPDGGAIGMTPGSGGNLEHGQEIKEGQISWLTDLLFQVEVVKLEDFSFTLKTRYYHPFNGIAIHGVCKDDTGEVWLFQEGFGVSGEHRVKQWLNYLQAPRMWKQMAAKLARILRECDCESDDLSCECVGAP